MKDQDYMKVALQLAEQGSGQTSPNPLVGAVVVKNGQIIGMGAHLKAGEPHAEVHAVRMAGSQAEDSTVYVTLEPCSHHGKTPPCANLLISSKVKRVVVAAEDPNPLVAGRGMKKLQAAGIEVVSGVLKNEAEELNKVFFHYIQTKRPFVTLKWAGSLDGKTATVTGESKWITGEPARKDVHKYREVHDAILAGVETVIKDDPSLTCRLENPKKQPVRIVLDTHLRTPETAGLVNDGHSPVWIITGSEVSPERIESFQKKNAVIIQMNTPAIEIDNLLHLLGERNITSLFVEGGATVHGSFIKSGLFNQVVSYTAPMLIGGKEAPPAVAGAGFSRINEAIRLKIKETEILGDDLKIVCVKKEG
ncbi:bifunctional diaminohydroxyphosphoribosylaminopyrimidine deaminase/5-amino-6-(5-phosphoribosylamino)uracil reductase RibD [Metabacillus idriensis]|uniref:bifunctional diaminohydroxyphosphoribosylaminopyrimidine deaminase/5-amino-6-(5-phosphoribosylamino)uracil reductase RibD n=1 Tax=Metabacillus idriensis TaxID=324768 RepID=UPI002813DD4F|nr:bifunctional diaminohydroxyphosphoribosylaminopyrimidine deaminase/5-amino-6-(5-phosphoribosylamino)uracil reductase RibD [Metabacillus idriensis]MDR0138531.1 bifunctional diaminohydroxyphosphoribosylaminopyrimidine deaminase/5-amino-6-(5-phosphoribosylamino)uracil reductase RibD [Metabacillus idriensis]